MQNDTETMGYIDTHYTRTLAASVPTSTLNGTVEADVCIIGGGIAGVSTAWELVNRGMSVVLVEARRISWGASGRNGGILSAGWAASSEAIAAASGAKDGRALFDLSREGIEIVLGNTRDLNLVGVDPVKGVIVASRYPDSAGMQAAAAQGKQDQGRDMEYLSPQAMRDLIKSDRFHDGVFDHEGHHIHPLNYVVGIAAESVRKGVQIFENSAMVSMELSGAEKIVRTTNGQVKSKYVVQCGSGYSGPEFGALRRSLLPIATYVVSTQGLGGRVADIMNTRAAVADTRMSCDYFRVTADGELLWGGGMSGLAKEPANLKSLMKQRVMEVFPQLEDVDLALSWTGLMGYARHKMPYVQQMRDNVWAATALGGHGLNTGPAIGRVVAEAIAENGIRHKLFKPYGLRWNGSFMGPLAADSICAFDNFRHSKRERSLK